MKIAAIMYPYAITDPLVRVKPEPPLAGVKTVVGSFPGYTKPFVVHAFGTKLIVAFSIE